MMSCHWIMNKVLLILSVFLLAACAEKSENQLLLDRVLSLCLDSEYEMADEFFAKHRDELKQPLSEADSMYTVFLGEVLSLNTIEDDVFSLPQFIDTTKINTVIDYYIEHPDKEKLALSYLIKSMKLYMSSRQNDGVYCFKQAENIINTLNNNTLYMMLESVRVNYMTNNMDFKSGVRLVDEMMKYAVNQKDRNACHISKAFFYMAGGNTDSAKYCMKLSSVDTTDYGYMGEYAWIFADDEPEKAEQYARKVLTDKPKSIHSDYAKLAIVNLYIQRGQLAEIEPFLKNNPIYGSYTQILCVEKLFYCFKENGDNEKAVYYAGFLNKMNHVIVSYITDYKVAQNSQKYDYENSRLKTQNFIQLLIIIFIIVIMVCVLFIYRQRRGYENELAVNRQILKESRDRIEELKAVTSSDNTKEINRLQAKISEIENRYAELYREGKQLYEQIFVNNGNSGQWNKKDYEKFLEYYKTVDLSLLAQIEGEYPGINPRQTFYKLLAAKDYDKPSIMKIMAIQEDVTFRALKSKVEGMRKK